MIMPVPKSSPSGWECMLLCVNRCPGRPVLVQEAEAVERPDPPMVNASGEIVRVLGRTRVAQVHAALQNQVPRSGSLSCRRLKLQSGQIHP